MVELLTTKEVARYLRLRPETVLRKVRAGEIPAIKVGGRFRFDKNQINVWLSRSATSKRHILVVDDDETIRELFRKTLELGNYHVITAESGVEALKLMKSWSFDLVFLDLKRSGMDGVEALRQIRQIDNSVPIVIITGYPTSELMEKALEQAPFGVMKKPFTPAEILQLTDTFCRFARSRPLTSKLEEVLS